MAVNLSPVGGVAGQFFDNNGNPLSGGKIFTYAAGTTTNQVTYTSATGVTAHSNPIILDAAGRVPGGEIWLTDGLSYKFVIKTSTDVLIGTFDNVTGINSNFVNYTIQEEIQTATAGQTVFTLTTMQYAPATGSLSVFVDGVNQYEGSTYSFVETNSTTVTFTAGLHVGAEVKFTNAVFTAGSVGAAVNVTFTGFKSQSGNVQDLADDDGSDWIGFDPAGTGAVARSAQDKMRDTVSVKDFGAVGDGVANDTTALQAALAAVVAQGGTLRIPAGTYNISGTLSTTSLPSPKKPFQIIGDGVNATVLNRLSGCGTMMNLRLAPDGVAVRDMTFNANASTAPTNANHTLIVGEASNVLVDNIVVNDPRTGGVMILSETSLGGGPIQNCLINNVRIFGVIGGGNIGVDVGILYAGGNVSYSGITNCYVKDVGKNPLLSPGDGIELKYTGEGCYIDNCYVENAIQGYGFATAVGEPEIENAKVSNITAKNCTAAVTELTNNSVFTNVIIDMDDDATLLEPIQIKGTGNTYTNVIIRNLANAVKFHARFIGTASRNYLQISEIYNTNNAKAIASFESGCVNNVVVVENMTTPSITSMITANIIQDNNTDKSLNRVKVNQLPNLVAATIASGVIKIANWVQTVYADTEGGAGTDDLDTITSGFNGQTIVLRSTANARDVVVKHNTGNIKLVGGTDFTLNNTLDSITLSYESQNAAWTEVSRSDVGA